MIVDKSRASHCVCVLHNQCPSAGGYVIHVEVTLIEKKPYQITQDCFNKTEKGFFQLKIQKGIHKKRLFYIEIKFQHACWALWA